MYNISVRAFLLLKHNSNPTLLLILNPTQNLALILTLMVNVGGVQIDILPRHTAWDKS